MASGVNYQNLTDVIVDTLRNLPRDEYELLFENPSYQGLHIFMKDRRISDGGKGIQRHIITRPDNNAAMVGLFNSKTPNVDSAQKLLFLPWCWFTANYSWDEREIIMNGPDDVGFVNLLRQRRDRDMWAISILLNNQMWNTPVNASDTTNMVGIPAWLPFLSNGQTTVNGTVATDGGFGGSVVRYQDGSTGTIIAGLDASSEPTWQSYAGLYNQVDNSLLRSLRIAVRRTHFEGSPLIAHPSGQNKTFDEQAFYANNDVVTALEDLGDKRDDSSEPMDLSGRIQHSFDGSIRFNQMPIRYNFLLDSETVAATSGVINPNSIYCLNWTHIQAWALKDYWMYEKKPMVQPAQPNVLTVNVDGGAQIFCDNRRTAGFHFHLPL